MATVSTYFGSADPSPWEHHHRSSGVRHLVESIAAGLGDADVGDPAGLSVEMKMPRQQVALAGRFHGIER
jgi:hypothetical protein